MSAALLSDPGAALERIAERLGSALPATVRAVGGAFDGAELRRHVTAAPCVLVACLGLAGMERRGTSVLAWSGEWAAYVLTRDTSENPRDRAAATLVATTLRAVYRSAWGDAATFGVPEDASIEATNLYGGDLDSVAVALWAVTWRQELRLSAA